MPRHLVRHHQIEGALGTAGVTSCGKVASGLRGRRVGHRESTANAASLSPMISRLGWSYPKDLGAGVMMSKEDLRKELEAGRVLFVIGTGVSFGATKRNPLASWPGLIESGIAECEQHAGTTAKQASPFRLMLQPDVIDTDNLITAAEFVTRKLGGMKDGTFKAWLRKSVGGLRAEYREVLEALRDLPGVLATTNYDDLLEDVTGLREVTWRQKNEVELVLNRQEKGIVHLHGHWRDSESVVLGIRSYEAVLHDPHAQTMLRGILATKTVVFVGCGEGLADPNFGALLNWARPVFSESERTHYRLALEREVDVLRAYHKGDRIKVVAYGADYPALAPFLRSLVPGAGAGTSNSGTGPTSGTGGPILASSGYPKLEDPLVMRPFRDIEALRQLATLLQKACLPWSLLKQQFWHTVPKNWLGELAGEALGEAERCANLVDVLSRFGTQTAASRPFPLLEFVLRVCLAPECDAVIAGLLRNWLDSNALVVGVGPAALKMAERRLVGALYLLVKLEHASLDSFRVQAWLGDDTGAALRSLLDGDRPLKREDIPVTLGALWARGPLRERLQVVDPARLTVEFILPRELLSLAVDEWRIPPGDASPRIGCRSRVVVRPLERVYAAVRPSLDDAFNTAPLAWQGKWNTLLQRAQDAEPLWVLTPDDHQPDVLTANLLLEHVVCLAIALTPPDCPETTLRQVLQRSIQQGVPMALWFRQEGAKPDTLHGFLRPLMNKLNELPDAVREARRCALAAADPSNPGHHLTLLWDDPARVPPDARPDDILYAPALIS